MCVDKLLILDSFGVLELQEQCDHGFTRSDACKRLIQSNWMSVLCS